ncbi:benzoate 4-monooxygenase cytochrome P450 [Colletotrichum somersetense]|nr:benzoate 4-monooxygenase cytochrome P450 [Colletotrichum somersetense]
MIMIRSRRSRAFSEYCKMSNEYGKLVRIGPNDVLTSDADLIRRMSAGKSTYERSSWYKATRLDPYHDMMGSVLDKSTHHGLRVKLSPGYMGKDIPGLEASIDTGIVDLCDLIRRKYTSKPAELSAGQAASVDFGRLADIYAMDARSRMSFGQPIGLVEKDEDVYGLVKTSKLAIDFIQFLTDIPPLQAIAASDLMLGLLGPKPTDKSGFGKVMGLAKQHVAARFGPDAKDEPDLLGSFIRRGLDQRSTEAEIMFPMIAGADTAAKAIKWTLQEALMNRTVYESLTHEIMSAISDGSISEPITSAETQKLPMLQAVVYESLRVHPPFTGLLMKEVGPGGDLYEGKFLPPGTRVGHDTWSVTHDKELFGEDADVFRPNRWLEADAATLKEWKKRTELVFGAGRWQCAGKAVALIELNKIIVELIRNFDFKYNGTAISVVIFSRKIL